MPHKHTRKSEDISSANLPPNAIARPLPVSKSASTDKHFTTELSPPNRANAKQRKRKKPGNNDDTPKAFLRLMAFQQGKKLPKALDDGLQNPRNKKRTQAATVQQEQDTLITASEETQVDVLRIKPGEKMSEFSARVDAALPVSGLISKNSRNGKDPLALKKVRTKTEKKMQRMYAEWREQDKRIKEKAEERELEEEMDEDENGQMRWKADIAAAGNQKKGKKRKRMLDGLDGRDGDPWSVIKRNRGEDERGRRDINDVVKAPPVFSRIPREIHKVSGVRVAVGDVPRASGSLRRREELEEVRRGVVEGYRAMMKGESS